jgi:hypothetical protein
MTVDQRAVSHEARQSGFSGFESAHAHKELAHRSAGRRCKCRSDAEVGGAKVTKIATLHSTAYSPALA